LRYADKVLVLRRIKIPHPANRPLLAGRRGVEVGQTAPSLKAALGGQGHVDQLLNLVLGQKVGLQTAGLTTRKTADAVKRQKVV
jgi:hypothetical protein